MPMIRPEAPGDGAALPQVHTFFLNALGATIGLQGMAGEELPGVVWCHGVPQERE